MADLFLLLLLFFFFFLVGRVGHYQQQCANCAETRPRMNTAPRKVGWIESRSKLPHAGRHLTCYRNMSLGKDVNEQGHSVITASASGRYCITDGEQFINRDWWFGTFSRFFGFYKFVSRLLLVVDFFAEVKSSADLYSFKL